MVVSEWAAFVALVGLALALARLLMRLRWRATFAGVGALLLAIGAGLYYPLQGTSDAPLLGGLLAAGILLLGAAAIATLRRRGDAADQGRFSNRHPGTRRPPYWRPRRSP